MSGEEADLGHRAMVVTVKENTIEGIDRPVETLSENELEQHTHHHLHSDHRFNNVACDGESSENPDAEEKTVPEVRIRIPESHDIEAGAEIAQSRTTRTETGATDSNLVGWDGPEDPENPKNWPSRRKWAATLVMSSFTFITPVASAIVAPAFNNIGAEFHVCFHPGYIFLVVCNSLMPHR
jgi:hypothetical protein